VKKLQRRKTVVEFEAAVRAVVVQLLVVIEVVTMNDVAVIVVKNEQVLLTMAGQ
jgi:hypothetical protein